MRKTISFGKVDGYGNGRKTCEVTLEVELRDTDKGPEFSVCANLWNNLHTDVKWCGQCVDDLFWEFGKQMQNPKLYSEILQLWKKYHLNGMNAGTPEQTEAVEEWKAQGNQYDYAEVCDYLKEIGLYEVPLDKELYPDVWEREAEEQETDNPTYKYGHAWLYREIPEASLKRIKEIIGEV